MKKETKKKIQKVYDTNVKIKKGHLFIGFMCLIFISVFISGFVFFSLGEDSGIQKIRSSIDRVEREEVNSAVMELEVEEVQDIFLKYLMIKTMNWLPLVMFLLLLGWVFHGIF